MSPFARLALWVFSTCWLLPLGLGLFLLFDWFEFTVTPSIRAGESNENLNSWAPYIPAKLAILVGFAWMAVVVFYWSSRLLRRGSKS